METLTNDPSVQRQEKNGHTAIEWFGRIGYGAKGFVYVVIGSLALMEVLGIGGGEGDTTGSRGALMTLDRQPFGDIVLYIVAAGLVLYTLWRWAQGFFDVENKGSEGKALIRRGGLVISGALYGFLAYNAFQLARTSDMSGAAGNSGNSERASEAMALPGGTWLVVIVGVAFVVTGLYQVWRAYSLDFKKHWKGSLHGSRREWATRISRFGITARAVIFIIMGGYIVQAGLNANPEQTRGLGDVLQSFASDPWLLGSTAAGLICYALYSWITATYRRIPAP